MTDISVAGETRAAAPPRRWRSFGRLAETIAAEGERRVLWLPVFFGAGVALYFALTVEPPWWVGLVAAAAALAAMLTLRRRPAWRGAALCALTAAAGLAAIQESAREHAAPMLERRVGSTAITGRVVDIDTLERGWRIVVAVDAMSGLPERDRPRRVRVHVSAKSDLLSPGDRVELKASLYPVPAPSLPGGHDMQRELFFAEIGGVGYSLGGARRIAEDEPAGGGWRQWILQIRTEVTRRVTAVLTGSTGGVATAVIAGKRGTMDEAVKEAFRNSGLSHLLAIAGLHLGLVGAFVFFAVRGGLALIPYVALRHPIKKIAAGATLVVLFCYLLLSGAAIPTERAFVMNGIVFAAIMLDRLRISMRICAIAAAVVLVLQPESLAGVSFQLSFGAVVALIAVYEAWGPRLARVLHRGGAGRKVIGYAAGVAVTTLIATVGTEPFAIYHFHKLVLYSPLANVIAVPISAMWTLPWGVVACLLMPLGLEHLALIPMGWGIDVTIWVAQCVAALPGNIWAMPRMPAWGAVLVALGGLWLCLWQGRWRRWGIPVMLLGLASMLTTRPPDIVINDLGRFVAARSPGGDYYVSADKNERVVRSLFAGETHAELLPWPAPGTLETGEGGLACGEGRCFYAARGRRVAIVSEEKGLPARCDEADAIVAQVPAGFACRKQIPVVDRIDTWRRGAVGLWLDESGITIEGANDHRGDRPWVPHPLTRAERAAKDRMGPTPPE